MKTNYFFIRLPGELSVLFWLLNDVFLIKKCGRDGIRQWIVNYTGTQSFKITLSYTLAQKLMQIISF